MMERKSIIMLLACVLLFACAGVLLASYALHVEVGYVVSLALGLMGTVFWVNAE